jgi:hypothetical protein
LLALRAAIYDVITLMQLPRLLTNRPTRAALVATLAFAGALMTGRAVRAEYPSEAWSPYPCEPWSPRLAALPREANSEFHTPPLGTQSVFVAPPLDESTRNTDLPTTTVPLFAGGPPCDFDRVQSHFLPRLGRHGLVAPHTPGVESVHSPLFLAPEPCDAPVEVETLFAPPEESRAAEPRRTGGWGPAEGAPPATDDTRGSAAAGGFDLGHADGELFSAPMCNDSLGQLAPFSTEDFAPDPFYDALSYNACAEQGVYGDKYLNPTQRPLVELGMPLYQAGPVPPPSTHCGETNPSLPRLYVYGDYRAAVAYNDQNGRAVGVLAHRLNVECDLWLTSTERFHMFTGPFQEGNNFMRVELDDDEAEFFDELDFFDADTDTLFFEGDLGYMIGGWTGRYAPIDLPVAVGLIPLLFQNGVWMEDAIVGVAATIPARNSAWLDWSNYDITFFAGFDQVTSPAFDDSNAAASVFGATTFIEAKGGYIEAGYAFLDDTAEFDRSYHNVGISYTRRYLNLVSNSIRVIVNAGQDGPQGDRSADGVLLIAENSFLTPWPYNVIPYVNLFVGFDDPQSVARAGAAGGVLRNTGILFESDNLTGYPTLDATGNDTYGAAIGLDLLAPEYRHQLILEAAVLQAFDDPAFRNAPGDQYGLGMRYQVPISHAHLLRFDVMHGWLENADDLTGARAEFRWKF